jgi:peptidase E
MKLVLIGGGHYGTYPDKPYNLKEIDERIVSLSGKTHPRLLFIGFTIRSNHTFGYMKKHYMELGAQCEHLCYNEFSNQKTVDGKFKRADIIYIGGGNTISFMQKLKKFNLDKKIIECANQNKVIVGRSAGAIIISSAGSSDSRIYKDGKKYTYVKGLGLIGIFLAPHYMDSDRPSDMKRMLLKNKKQIAIGLDSCSALVVDGENFETVSSASNACVYKVFFEDEVVQYKLSLQGKLCDLLNKQ